MNAVWCGPFWRSDSTKVVDAWPDRDSAEAALFPADIHTTLFAKRNTFVYTAFMITHNEAQQGCMTSTYIKMIPLTDLGEISTSCLVIEG